MADKEYRAWVQTLPSCLSGKFSEWLSDLGEWRNPACHVRRAATFGTGFRDVPFTSIPLTHEEHAYQHQYGELACLAKYTHDPQLKCTLLNASPVEAERIAKEWFDSQVIKYREMWRKRAGNEEALEHGKP
jgi:hypothetical protein